MGMFLNRGNQEFDYVVNSEIYVDKTEMITFFNKKINTEQRYISVSRPRRFGKSITANMIAAYFEKGCDSRYLFENRKLGETKNWDQNLNKYDVIRIDLADIRSRRENPEETLDYIDEMVADKVDFIKQSIIHGHDDMNKVIEFCNVVIDSFENFSKLDFNQMTNEDMKNGLEIMKKLSDKEFTTDTLSEVIKNAVGFNMDKATAEIIDAKNAEIRELKKKNK